MRCLPRCLPSLSQVFHLAACPPAPPSPRPRHLLPIETGRTRRHPPYPCPRPPRLLAPSAAESAWPCAAPRAPTARRTRAAATWRGRAWTGSPRCRRPPTAPPPCPRWRVTEALSALEMARVLMAYQTLPGPAAPRWMTRHSAPPAR